MLAGMTPILKEGEFVFCTTMDTARCPSTWFREDEGISNVLDLQKKQLES